VEASPPSCDDNWIELKDARVDIEDADSSRNQCDVKPEFTAGSKNVIILLKVCVTLKNELLRKKIINF
jgi:hypothetical protein